jgi:hypothetical protein
MLQVRALLADGAAQVALLDYERDALAGGVNIVRFRARRALERVQQGEFVV